MGFIDSRAESSLTGKGEMLCLPCLGGPESTPEARGKLIESRNTLGALLGGGAEKLKIRNR